MAGVREFFQTPAGKGVAGVFVLAAVAGAAYSMFSAVRGDPAIRQANSRIFVDADNDKQFEVDLANSKIPAVSPFTGKARGYPAELCYWTKDGKPKDEPTGVLMNAIRGRTGPTFCPECGRLVVPYNPKPAAGAKPPPTQAEYAASHTKNSDE